MNYHYIMTFVPRTAHTLYIRVHYKKLEFVTDMLFDAGLKVGQLAEWMWAVQLAENPNHGAFDPNGETFDIDHDDDEEAIFKGVL
jgi:hypothetical protein